MQRNRFVAAVVAAVCVIAGVLVPQAAFARPYPIAYVAYDRLYSTDPHLVVVRLKAFDASGQAVPFRGTVALVDRAALVRPTSVDGMSAASSSNRTVRIPIASRTGRAAVARVDVRRMTPSPIGLAVTWTLTRVGEAATRTDTPPVRLIPLVQATAADAARPGVKEGETIVRAVESDAFTAYASYSGEWPCVLRTLTFGRGVCTLHRQAEAARAAGAGPRLTFTWKPMLRASGKHYRRCLVLPDLTAPPASPAPSSNGTGSFDDTLAAPRAALGVPPEPTDRTPGLDVPGDWTSVTVPAPTVPGTAAVVPGTTVIRWTLSCYDSTADKPVTRPETDVVPDLVPTRPVAVEAERHGRIVTLAASGSRARGAAPVLRYEAAVVDGRRSARRITLPASGERVQLRGLGAGRLRVVVRAVNEVGASAPRTVQVVVR